MTKKMPRKKKITVRASAVRSGTRAIEVGVDSQYVVGLKALRVVIKQDDGGFFAQGLEIDYAASGDSLDEVKENFETGLGLTISKHLEMFGTIRKMLKLAPQPVWDEYLESDQKLSYSDTFFTDLRNIKSIPREAMKSLSFSGIAYAQPVAALG